LAVFDKVFANPLWPADAVDVKAQALGMWRFWISCRYYAAHRWNDARRNLSEALDLRPHLLAEPAELVKLFSDDALSPRVGDPFAFLTSVLDHLPPEAEGLQQYRPQLLSRVYVGLALRNYGLGNLAEARDQLAQATVLNPAMLEQLEGFAELLYTCAMCLPVSTPLSYVDMVLQNLPPEAQRLGRVRARVLGDVNVGCAFEDYSAGRRLPTVRRILAALRYRPSWLRNRGVVSIFLRSLLGLAARQHSPS
jgi:tetratricopeptide (TPR) repeat protein